MKSGLSGMEIKVARRKIIRFEKSKNSKTLVILILQYKVEQENSLVEEKEH